MLTGEEVSPLDDFSWNAQEKFYTLTEMRVWPTDRGIQGFEVMFETPSNFTGYPPLI